MAIPSELTIALTRGATDIRLVKTLSTEKAHDVDVTVPGGENEVEINWSLDITQAELIFILSDQDLTLKTNSSSEPGDTITLKADIPYFWMKDGGIDQPLSVDVTKLYATRAEGEDANLQIRSLADATPVE